jgi:hypothetical protein
MQSLSSALPTPMVKSLEASGYSALQTFLSHILDSKKIFFVLLAAITLEILE